jgi:nucleotide-binding universal stress UspA family protein
MRILIMSDGSPEDNDLLRFSAQLLRDVDEPPTLLVVVDSKSGGKRQPVDSLLANAREILGAQNIQIEVRSGALTDVTISTANEGGYDLLIVGELKSRKLTPMFSKPDVLRVVQAVSCSVLVVKGEARELRRILLCDSGAGRATKLAQFTAQFMRMLHTEGDTTVLHVMSQISAGPGVRGKQLRSDADALIQERAPEGDLLRRDVQALVHAGLHPVPKVRHGLVLDEILSEARTGDYDLVVIGTHPYDGWQAFLLDDLAQKIVARLDRPVLVVKKREYPRDMVDPL